MNLRETQQVVARDEKWVPSIERVKISSTNVRLETTVHQKEETFRVIIDVIKNSTCFKAFTITAEVLEIFMQQFWYTIKKVKDSESYEFFLANKKCIVDAEVFRKILDICPRFKGEEFTKVQDDDVTFTFLIDLGYKGPLHKYTNMYVDHMNQPWRTLAAIINKCLSRKAESIDVSEESEPKPAKKKTDSRSTRGVFIKDPPSAPKPKPTALKLKLKGVQSLTPKEQEAADTMQALKESKKTSRRQPGTRGSSEGTGRIPGVLDESTVVSATSSEGTENESEHFDDSQLNFDVKEKKDNDGDADDEGDDHISDIQDTNDEDAETESDVDEIYKYKIHVRKDVDVEMAEDETVERNNNEKDEMTDAAKADVEKTTEEKGNAELVGNVITSDYQVKVSTEFPLPSSSDSTKADVSSLMDIHIQQETPQIQSLSVQKVLVSVISETTSLPPIPETLTKTLVSIAISPPHVTPTISIDVSELKKNDLSAEALATLKPQVPTVVDNYLRSKLESEKSASEIRKIKREQAERRKMIKYIIKSADKATLKEYDLKSALYQTMHENKSFNKNPANHALYHALMEALIEYENAMDKGVADTVKNHKRHHDDDDDDDEDPSSGPNQGKKTKRRRTKESESSKKPSTTKETPKGKALSKGSKTGKSASAKEPVEEPIVEVAMDDVVNTTGEDVVRDDYQTQDTSEPKTNKTPNLDWFKQPIRPSTPDPEWNKHQVVLDQPKQPWFNQMVSTIKDPLTLNDLMATSIDQPAYNLLKGTCTSSIELEYNFQECFNALIDKLDWNNPEGDCYPFDLSKPLPLQGRPDHLTVVVDYFFNNDLEYLKTSDPEQIIAKKSLDFELQLQHEKERRRCESSLKNVCETSWISKMEKLESENVSLEFQVQSLIKERENVKTEYQKLFDSIKRTQTETQGEINELIENINQKTYAYVDVRA
ncbi:hypothetical protein Tco_0154398 [Tanacetum coccineum]